MTKGNTTTYLERFIEVLGLLSRAVPPREMCEAWLNDESEELQGWVASNARMDWMSGIGAIEAAQALADAPEESDAHEGYYADSARARREGLKIFHLFGVTPKKVEAWEVPAVQYHDYIVAASTLDEAVGNVLEYADARDMAEIWAAEDENTKLALVSPQTRLHVSVSLEQHLHWARVQEQRYHLVHEGPQSLRAWNEARVTERQT